jgi:flagellar basal body-associated protein FliL
MANEQIQEITPSGGGGGNPMIPVIAVLVIMPVLSFVLTKFLFIPQIQTAVNDAVAKAAAGGEIVVDTAAKGGPSEKGKDDAHGAAGDSEGGTAAPADGGKTYTFEGIIANLSGSSVNRYVKVSFIIEGDEASFAATMEANRVKLIDATITVLSSLTSLELQNAGVKNQVRSKLIAAFDSVLKRRMVTGLYFSEFVVQ